MRHPVKYALYLLSAALILAAPINAARAQNSLDGNSKEPLEVTADGTLEWLREEKRFVATKNARAKQGDSSLAGEKISAAYREGKDGGGMDIYQITAAKNVVLKSRDTTVYGQDAIYNLDQGLATITGDNLKMVSPDQTITARDKFEYWTIDGRINAIGNAKVVRPKLGGGADTLHADKISAILKKNEKGEQVLHSLEAIGNVVIITPGEKITGAYGIYKSASNQAELTGGVKIIRGPNILEGDRAVVDMTTNISTIFATKTPTNGASTNTNTSGRVRGIFYPGSEEKPDSP